MFGVLANQNQNQLNLLNHRFLLDHPIDCSFHTNKEQLTGKVWSNAKWISQTETTRSIEHR